MKHTCIVVCSKKINMTGRQKEVFIGGSHHPLAYIRLSTSAQDELMLYTALAWGRKEMENERRERKRGRQVREICTAASNPFIF